MSNLASEWQGPMKPWEIVQKRFFNGQAPDAAAFAQKHALDEAGVRRVFSGETETFSPMLCVALSRETGMSIDFFRNLSVQNRGGVIA